MSEQPWADLCWPGSACHCAGWVGTVSAAHLSSGGQTGSSPLQTGRGPTDAPNPDGHHHCSHHQTADVAGVGTDLHTDKEVRGRADRWQTKRPVGDRQRGVYHCRFDVPAPLFRPSHPAGNCHQLSCLVMLPAAGNRKWPDWELPERAHTLPAVAVVPPAHPLIDASDSWCHHPPEAEDRRRTCEG